MKSGPFYLVLPVPKYLDPQIIYFNFAEIFGPSRTKFSVFTFNISLFKSILNSQYTLQGIGPGWRVEA